MLFSCLEPNQQPYLCKTIVYFTGLFTLHKRGRGLGKYNPLHPLFYSPWDAVAAQLARQPLIWVCGHWIWARHGSIAHLLTTWSHPQIFNLVCPYNVGGSPYCSLFYIQQQSLCGSMQWVQVNVNCWVISTFENQLHFVVEWDHSWSNELFSNSNSMIIWPQNCCPLFVLLTSLRSFIRVTGGRGERDREKSWILDLQNSNTIW